MDPAIKLALAVGAWLQYEFACDRSELFNERCMSAPIASCLHALYKQEVRSEYLHPILAPLKSGPGRRPEVDFVVVTKYPEISCVLESKWIGATRVKIEDILWDLLRLELIAHQTQAAAFFLLAGRRRHLESLFQSKGFRGKRTTAGKYRTILKMHPQPNIRVAGPVEGRERIFRKVLVSYQDISFPNQISTSVGHAYPKACPMFQYQAYVWHVHSPVGGQRFFPRNHSLYRRGAAN
jgi:hypothetical protein